MLLSNTYTGFYHINKNKSSLPHQISEVVTILSGHESAGVAKTGDVLDVGLQSWRVGFQHDVNECGEEVICRRSLFLAHFNSVEDVLTAAGYAGQLVLGHTL